MIPRIIEDSIRKKLLESKKVIILYGARQVGKTTLAKAILKKINCKILEINADQQLYAEILSSRSLETLIGLVSGYDILFIDEAQRIRDIGINLKILHDEIPDLKILVTGSSSLELASRIKEPLTGRTWTYRLFPISITEWKLYTDLNNFEISQKLNDWMLYGLYPELLSMENYNDKRTYLQELTSAYLYKDILTLANINYPDKLRQLLKLIAFQIGNLVSIHELANTLQINRETVIHYIDLLEKSFVLFRLSGFSRNLRKEITKMDKIYFYDLGVRNSIIENFNSVQLRNDAGVLWENFLIVERMKNNAYKHHFANTYFWRTHTGAELDYIEEKDGNLNGYEFKWKKKNSRKPKTWLETYSNSSYSMINQNNFAEFIFSKDS